MAVVAHVVVSGITTVQYDQVREAVGWLDEPPAGGLCHVTWWEGGNCHNTHAWEAKMPSTLSLPNGSGRAWPRPVSIPSRGSRFTPPTRSTRRRL